MSLPLGLVARAPTPFSKELSRALIASCLASELAACAGAALQEAAWLLASVAAGGFAELPVRVDLFGLAFLRRGLALMSSSPAS